VKEGRGSHGYKFIGFSEKLCGSTPNSGRQFVMELEEKCFHGLRGRTERVGG